MSKAKDLRRSVKAIKFKLRWLRGYSSGLTEMQKSNRPISETIAKSVDEIESSLCDLIDFLFVGDGSDEDGDDEDDVDRSAILELIRSQLDSVECRVYSVENEVEGLRSDVRELEIAEVDLTEVNDRLTSIEGVNVVHDGRLGAVEGILNNFEPVDLTVVNGRLTSIEGVNVVHDGRLGSIEDAVQGLMFEVQEHNVSDAAHADIRALIGDFANQTSYLYTMIDELRVWVMLRGVSSANGNIVVNNE